MKTKNWKELASELENLAYTNYEPAQVKVVITKDLEGNPDGLEVFPKSGTGLYATEEIVDFCRCKKLNNCISCHIVDDKPVAFARIF